MKKPDHIDRVIESIPQSARITGCCLSLHNQALHLAVFYLNDRFQRKKCIARLDKFMQRRNQRLQ